MVAALFQQVGPFALRRWQVSFNNDTLISLPGAEGAFLSDEYLVVDNLKLASSGNPLTISARTSDGTSAVISNPGGSVRLTWTAGGFYALG